MENNDNVASMFWAGKCQLIYSVTHCMLIYFKFKQEEKMKFQTWSVWEKVFFLVRPSKITCCCPVCDDVTAQRLMSSCTEGFCVLFLLALLVASQLQWYNMKQCCTFTTLGHNKHDVQPRAEYEWHNRPPPYPMLVFLRILMSFKENKKFEKIWGLSLTLVK